MSKQLTVVADETLGIAIADYIDGTLGGHGEDAATRLVGHLISIRTLERPYSEVQTYNPGSTT